MMDIDQFEAALDTIANTLPPAFYEELNGGICFFQKPNATQSQRGRPLHHGSIIVTRSWGAISSFITALLSGCMLSE